MTQTGKHTELKSLCIEFLYGLYDMRERGQLSSATIPDDDEWVAVMIDKLENLVGGRAVTRRQEMSDG